jgi:hypothetical protein
MDGDGGELAPNTHHEQGCLERQPHLQMEEE